MVLCISATISASVKVNNYGFGDVYSDRHFDQVGRLGKLPSLVFTSLLLCISRTVVLKVDSR